MTKERVVSLREFVPATYDGERGDPVDYTGYEYRLDGVEFRYSLRFTFPEESLMGKIEDAFLGLLKVGDIVVVSEDGHITAREKPSASVPPAVEVMIHTALSPTSSEERERLGEVLRRIEADEPEKLLELASAIEVGELEESRAQLPARENDAPEESLRSMMQVVDLRPYMERVPQGKRFRHRWNLCRGWFPLAPESY